MSDLARCVPSARGGALAADRRPHKRDRSDVAGQGSVAVAERPQRPASKMGVPQLLLLLSMVAFAVSVVLLVRRLALESPQRTVSAPQEIPLRSPSVAGSAHTPGSAPVTVRAGGGSSAGDTVVPLAIESKPRALVYADGKRVGQTPLRIDGRYGRAVRLVLVAEGRKLFRTIVTPSPGGQNQVVAQLERASYPRFIGRRRGLLRVRCLPSDTRRIMIDGQDSGRSCPAATFSLPQGRHQVGFQRLVDGETKAVGVRIRSGRTKRLQLTRR